MEADLFGELLRAAREGYIFRKNSSNLYLRLRYCTTDPHPPPLAYSRRAVGLLMQHRGERRHLWRSAEDKQVALLKLAGWFPKLPYSPTAPRPHRLHHLSNLGSARLADLRRQHLKLSLSFITSSSFSSPARRPAGFDSVAQPDPPAPTLGPRQFLLDSSLDQARLRPPPRSQLRDFRSTDPALFGSCSITTRSSPYSAAGLGSS